MKKPDTHEELKLARQVCFPFYAATNLLQRLYRPLLAPLGLTYSQYLVMMVLWEHEQATVGELKACLHLDNGTLTPLLKRMEQARHIVRSRDPADERRVIIALTPEGSALRRPAREIPGTLLRQLGVERAQLSGLQSTAQDLVRLLAEHAQ
ncbi:MarR family transcriptional regulator [Burkholderia sp. Ac-20353]|uniref:MarR family winged helix-turn-helix transcriptional regulator n=1 Tax=Burkholderia sp. Ac-20353 TaxID=2703894 RepID=UPI001F119493|nr:MarR family transcriptional regulator [Burkholderia sp. Ac-20353]MBN3786680.1 MarR family transcriptional regulator [Burkholderia sp. Ac-20353]